MEHFKRLLNNTPARKHEWLRSALNSSAFQSQLFVDEYLAQITTILEEKKLSDKDFADLLGLSKPAVSKLFCEAPNLSVKRMMSIANKLGYTIEPPKVTENNIDELFAEATSSNTIKMTATDFNEPSECNSANIYYIRPKNSFKKDVENPEEFMSDTGTA
ncbi:MAG: XRE family transcriptional regulator [Balneolales bacterium]